MSRFRTIFTIPPSTSKMNHHQDVLSIGSCFAQNIGGKLHNLKFRTLLNPFGIIYNPISIVNSINLLLENEPYQIDKLFQNGSSWHSFDYHSAFSGLNKENTHQNIQNTLEKGRNFIQNTDFLLITLGTAYAYFNKSTDEIVANCHKLPSNIFHKQMLSVEWITGEMSRVIQKLTDLNPNLKIIMTVSPIRHVKDGIVENQRSKSTLILACAELERRLDEVEYFPAYELVMDDLRDYRFYEKDMLHPNEQAIDYIWEQFCKTYFEENTIQLNRQIQQIVTASQHRPFHPTSNEHKKFVAKQIQKINQLKEQYDFLDFEKELGILWSYI